MSSLLQLFLLFIAAGAVFYLRKGLLEGLAITAGALVILTVLGGFKLLPWLLFIVVAAVSIPTVLRRELLSQPIFTLFKKLLPPMSSTEEEAIEAGDVWWDGDLFSGKPDWDKWRGIEKPALTEEEQAFLDNQVETLCGMLDDWAIVNTHKDLPPEVWDYLKKEGFLGMIIPKEYGGLGFSALAHSSIVMKLATRSVSAAVTAMVPNSLGPSELLMEYGTEEQKNTYLPRLAKGEDIPCFALTAPDAGSDAGAIQDSGIVCKGQHEGKEVLGIRLNWNKRYITLAPVATLVGLAFKLYDPDHLLGDEEKSDYGISVALIPADHEGVEIGRRHIPMYMAFMNGPTTGKDVFIPLDWLLGGVDYAGQGWKMLVECLSAGRAISLPSLGTATAKLCYRATGAYSRVRKQFNLPIGYFEGVEEALARIAGNTYLLEATRLATVQSIDLGEKPSVITAIAKYHMTELGRQCSTDAMDVHGGHGLIMGEKNFLGHGYMATPISITVEGANILTRNLMIFGQGVIRCHPFVYDEMKTTLMEDESAALIKFDNLLWRHIAHSVSSGIRSFVLALTLGRGAGTNTPNELKLYYGQISRFSAALSFCSDIAMGVMGGDLKRRERLSARLGDVLSALYMASCLLKYYEDNGCRKEELPLVRWNIRKLLSDVEHALANFCENFPVRPLALFLRLVMLPYGVQIHGPNDNLDHQVSRIMMKPGELRDRITAGCYTGDSSQPVGALDDALEKILIAKNSENELSKAQKNGVLPFVVDEIPAKLISRAVAQNILSEQEGEQVLAAVEARWKIIQVDSYTTDEIMA
jgi:alkylation response protein AidB-like acyl-CoA dehydrogenase